MADSSALTAELRGALPVAVASRYAASLRRGDGVLEPAEEPHRDRPRAGPAFA